MKISKHGSQLSKVHQSIGVSFFGNQISTTNFLGGCTRIEVSLYGYGNNHFWKKYRFGLVAPERADMSQKKLFSFEEMYALSIYKKCARIIFHLNNYLHLYIRRDGKRKKQRSY